jgi:hypothetical protein
MSRAQVRSVAARTLLLAIGAVVDFGVFQNQQQIAMNRTRPQPQQQAGAE